MDGYMPGDVSWALTRAGDMQDIVEFNNAEETTLDDILGLLDKGIAKVKEDYNVRI